ncbi:MAG: type IV secretion system DNA-binding domain-containing protein [Hyphomicrobiaceae bacterium]
MSELITAMCSADGRCPMNVNDVRIGTTTRGYQLAAPVALTRADLASHLHMIGGTGVGKTNLLRTLIYADLSHGRDFAVLDPLGGLAEAIVDAVPVERTERVVYWDPGAELDRCINFNPLFQVPVDRRHLVADGVVAAFMHIWNASLEETPRLTYWLYNALRLLLDDEREGPTLLGLPKLLVNESYREFLLKQCRDPMVKSIWMNEYAGMDERFRAVVVSPIQNKVGLLLSPPTLRNILGMHRPTLDLRRLMNGGGSIICNFAKGVLGQTGSKLLGALVATAIAQVAEERTTVPPHQRRPFTMYTDELQNFVTPSFATTLSEARQLALSFVGAHQYLAQLPENVQNSLIANAGSKFVFRISSDDARRLAHDLDIDNLSMLAGTSNHYAWCKLLRNGLPSDALLVEMDEAEPPTRGRSHAVKRQSNAIHTRPRAIVEAAILRSITDTFS